MRASASRYLTENGPTSVTNSEMTNQYNESYFVTTHSPLRLSRVTESNSS